MTTKEIFTAVTKELDITKAEIATMYNWTPQQLNGRLSRNSLRADELFGMMEAAGVEIVLRVRESGKEIKLRTKGYGPRVRQMVDKVIYDTAASEVLANNFYADGVNEYIDGRALELYVDREGRYFFAEYYNMEGVKNRIFPVTAKDAAAFIEKYGTDIFREHE